MEFWHEIATKKSFNLLQKLKRSFNFILIGGWAVWLYSHSMKSKDIDLIIDYEQLAKFKEKFSIFKNERLKKYQAQVEEVDIDLYLPYYSSLGLPVEEVKNYTIFKEGFRVPWPEVLLILKQKAYQDRRNSIKGEKDKIDIITLIDLAEFDFQKYKKILKKYKKKEFLKDLNDLLIETYEIKELGLNYQKFAKFKKSILAKIKKI